MFPPLRFASPDFEAENAAQRLPGLPLFLGRVLLNDVFSIGVLRIAHVLVFAVAYTVLLRSGSSLLLTAFLALILTEVALVAAAAAVKKILVGSEWGRAHSAPFWSWRHFTYFFAQDCFTAWCAIPLGMSAGTLMPNAILRRMGCRIGKRTILAAPLQAFDWNAVNIGDDCTVAGLLQFHTFENMLLKVKATHILNGSVVNAGATVMGGAVIEPDTTLLPLSLVMKEVHLPTAVYEGSPAEPRGSDEPGS